MTPKLRRFLDQVRPSTPYLVVDVDIVEANYLALAAALDGVQIEMPATVEKVWRACQALETRAAAE